jgi:hypothetical protein
VATRDNERETRREAILFSTRTLMNAVDTILSKQIAVAQMLATSPALQSDDLVTFRKEAEARGVWAVGRLDRAQRPGWATARQSLSARRGRAAAAIPHAVDLQRRAIETGQFQVSGVFNGCVAQAPVSRSKSRSDATKSLRSC